MQQNKKEHPKEKSRLHPRNKNRERYDFKRLKECCPDLIPFVKLNKFDDESIDFADPKSVKTLNKALLQYFYGIENWDIPKGYLCPPIPGRADYIHHISDLLCRSNYGKIPVGANIKCFDIGVGANCIYPIIGNKEYGWSFIGSDIDPVSIESANNIVEQNPSLKGKIECRLQKNSKDFFYGIISKDEIIDFSICNPPFHASLKDAEAGTLRKLTNLNKKKATKAVLNFGGNLNELCYEGGESRFVGNMVRESKKFSKQCFWFSTLISKQSILNSVLDLLENVGAEKIETIPMGQGNKTSRIVAWTFLTKEEQKNWRNTRWKEVL